MPSVIRKTWKENKIAGIDWLYGFMRRHAELTLRTPEATSIGRAQRLQQENSGEAFP